MYLGTGRAFWIVDLKRLSHNHVQHLGIILSNNSLIIFLFQNFCTILISRASPTRLTTMIMITTASCITEWIFSGNFIFINSLSKHRMNVFIIHEIVHKWMVFKLLLLRICSKALTLCPLPNSEGHSIYKTD